MNLHKKYCPYCGMVHFYFFKKEDMGRQCVCGCCLCSCSKNFVVKVKKLEECDTREPIVQVRKNGEKIECEVDLNYFLRELKKCKKLK